MRLSVDDETFEAVVRENDVVNVEAREHGNWISFRMTIPDDMVRILLIPYGNIFQMFKMAQIQKIRGLVDCEFEIFQWCELADNSTYFGGVLVQAQSEASESVQIL